MVLPGVVRKVSTAFLLLSLAGWITFGVGFGLRNFEYSQEEEESLSQATLYPDFTVFWLFGVSFPFFFVLNVVDLFCAYRLTASLAFLILPVYLVSAGGVLFFNGHFIYQYYQVESLNNESSVLYSDLELKLVVVDATLISSDLTLTPLLTDLDIHGKQRFVIIEFAGTLAAVFFSWIYLIVTPFFSLKKDYDNVYD